MEELKELVRCVVPPGFVLGRSEAPHQAGGNWESITAEAELLQRPDEIASSIPNLQDLLPCRTRECDL
jgi:hypothetical protein